MNEAEKSLYREYRHHIETDELPSALRGAILIFVILQTFVFIPADWVLHADQFGSFLAGRMLMNALLFIIYFATALRWPVFSSFLVCGLGSILFLAMVEATGGVASGYYAGMILLVIGMGVLTPQAAKHSALISGMIFASYLFLPLYSSHAYEARLFIQNLFFLAAACAEGYWASFHMERMRFRDYKQKRELEDARDALAELDQAKSRFSSNVHHELRTPLTLILAPLDAMRSGDFGSLPDSVKDVLSTMHSNGQRLYKMINNLLDLTKVESHQFKVVRRPTQIADIVTDLVEGSRPMAEVKGVRLSMQGFEDIPELNIDPEAVDKVLVNLIGNALKFTSDGDQIVVSALAEKDGIALSVKDSGAGIPSEKVEAIFDRFAQVDGSATRKYEGTGIGLALAREMVDLHEGKIHAFSEGLGHGSEFSVFLPWGEADECPDEAVIADEGGQLRSAGEGVEALRSELHLANEDAAPDRLGEMGRHVDRWEKHHRPIVAPEFHDEEDRPEILIAEDNPDMRALLAKLLGQEFNVSVARNGREALERIRQSPPDLLLSDIMMPEMSGIDLCRAIKENVETASIPVVLVTSKAEREMKIEGLELGADDYVTKPFHPRELKARVRSLVRSVSLQKQLQSQNQALEKALQEIKHAEVQLVQSERLAAVGELAAGIAHEVNNPVNFALNAVRTMESTVIELRDLAQEVSQLDSSDVASLTRRLKSFQKKQGGETANELAEALCELSSIVSNGLTRTSSLVGDLRDFARPGKESQMSQGVDVESGIRSTMTLVSHALQDANAEIEVQVEPRLPKIFADAGALNQVFLNLIKNSSESIGLSGGRVVVTAEFLEETQEVVVEVVDDGPGIDPEILHSLFDPFFTTKDASGGTGLGLSMSQGIVHAHGGRLEVESEPNVRTVFRVILPVAGPSHSEEECLARESA
ncbi:MAG: hypothetical protein CL917_02330 [Deltaproteobacteria bacterium]|nr:hypothetical protein [Deltaproteobacteria bacterium]